MVDIGTPFGKNSLKAAPSPIQLQYSRASEIFKPPAERKPENPRPVNKNAGAPGGQVDVATPHPAGHTLRKSGAQDLPERG
jgi:hypothetical protein